MMGCPDEDNLELYNLRLRIEQLEKDAKLGRWIKSRDGSLMKAICGGLEAAINDHGPITKEYLASAAKRVLEALPNGKIEDRNCRFNCSKLEKD